MFGIKLRIKAAALITAAAAAAAVFYGCGVFTPTGDGTKNRPGEAELSESLKPVFSDLGGFYTGKMSVTISIPKALEGASCIRITYDGSEPDKDSREYKGEDIILPDASHTDTDFDDGTRNVSVSVIRAACFDGSGNMAGQIATATYIRVEDEDRFAMPVISLVTDDRNLNDTYSGIFSNPDGTGSKWERPVNITFYEKDGTLGFTQDAGIRLFGGSSRNLAQRSFRITARKSSYFDTEVYDGKGKFRYVLFPGRYDSEGALLSEYDSIVLRNGGNDSVLLAEDSSRITFMRDGLAAVIAAKAAPSVDSMAYRPVTVFLNGEYYGIMNMREHMNENYIRNVYGIEDVDNITVISNEMDITRGGRYDGTWFYYEQKNGPEGEPESFTDMLDGIVNRGAYTYEEAAQLIDMDNFMKYCALNLFLCNTDWPHNNVRVWRYAGQTSDDTGKWHFMLKDADLGMGRYVCGISGGYPAELYTKADSRNIRFMLRQYAEFEDTSGYPAYDGPYYPDGLYIQGLFYFCMKDSGFRNGFTEFCRRLACDIWPYEELEKAINDAFSAIESEMPEFLNKDFGRYSWKATTDLRGWKDAVTGNRDSLMTWARERSGENGEFLKQVNEAAALFSSQR